jgi:beta-galactosidase GanA
MSVNTVSSAVSSTSVQYTLDVIQEEARRLVHKGVVSRQQPIYTLCQYIPAREWAWVECELEKNSYLLRDRIGDLMGHEEWQND